ncbi:hypothetical protein CYMTET_24122 [Cymbomonas tetramitiformis]|uniref:Uncharacterized protein n=1 Tax=Cymbomonas tetramitiformis TaxID=36881 RepID=A0AAE0FWF1_9CHLO|nr:hypothetical protein CYMTET_24122 [Cymbomonas tetramitiformis]
MKPGGARYGAGGAGGGLGWRRDRQGGARYGAGGAGGGLGRRRYRQGGARYGAGGAGGGLGGGETVKVELATARAELAEALAGGETVKDTSEYSSDSTHVSPTPRFLRSHVAHAVGLQRDAEIDRNAEVAVLRAQLSFARSEVTELKAQCGTLITTENKKLHEENQEVLTIVPRPELVPGTRVEVYWPLDRSWYPGEVGERTRRGRTRVTYDDGTYESLVMDKEDYRVIPQVKVGKAISPPASSPKRTKVLLGVEITRRGRALLEKYKTGKGYRAVYAPKGINGTGISSVGSGEPIRFGRYGKSAGEYARFDLGVFTEDEVVRASNELLDENPVYQAFSGLMNGSINCFRHLNAPCLTLDERAHARCLYQMSHYGGNTVDGKTKQEAMALMLHFIHANSRPAQGHILEKVGEHAKKVGLTPPDGVEPLIYVGRPSAEQCDELHEYGSGSMRTIKFYTLPSGSKLNLHADGNGQHEDAFLATLGRPAKDGTPIAMLLVASPEVLGGSTNPLHTEFALLPCFPGSIITLSGRLAIGGNLSDSSKGYLHGKPPIDLMAASEATPHVVLACKRFKLRDCDVRPEGAASESVMRPAGSIDYKNPLEAVYHRMYIIGPVAEEDAYAPLVESMRKRGDIWEPIDLHTYKQRARLQRGRHLWGPGMMVKHNTDLESLGLIPNIQFSPEVYMSRRIYKTPHKLLPRAIALVFSREEPRFMISSTGVHLDYDPSDTRAVQLNVITARLGKNLEGEKASSGFSSGRTIQIAMPSSPT